MESIKKEKKMKPYKKVSKQEAAALRRKEEANARRKVNESWELMAKSAKYKKAIMVESCRQVSGMVTEKFFGGVLLDLDRKTKEKSKSVQKRILRRIVEKRQAQSTFHKTGRTEDMFRKYQNRRNMSVIMNEISKYQFSA